MTGRGYSNPGGAAGSRAAGDEGAIWFSTLGPFLDGLAETVGIAPFPPEPFQPDHTQEEVPTP